MCRRHREQALLPHWVLGWPQTSHPPQIPCGSGLARDSGGSASGDVGCAAAIASKLCSHIGSSVGRRFHIRPQPVVGAKLARESGGSASGDVGCAAAIASKLCSHIGFSVGRRFHIHHQSPVGAGLLAIVVDQLVVMLDVPPPSRASFAPTLGPRLAADFTSTTNPLWERACSR